MPSGLDVRAVVEYRQTDDVDITDRIVVTIDGEVIEVPLCAYACRPDMRIDTRVEFGDFAVANKYALYPLNNMCLLIYLVAPSSFRTARYRSNYSTQGNLQGNIVSERRPRRRRVQLRVRGH